MFGCVQKLTVIIVHFDWEHDDLIFGYLRVPRFGISWTIFSHTESQPFFTCLLLFLNILSLLLLVLLLLVLLIYYYYYYYIFIIVIIIILQFSLQ